MNLIFINPPIEDFYYTSIRRQPLGLLYIMAAAENSGHNVLLINGHTGKKKIMPMPEKFAYLNKFITSNNPDYTFPFKNYYHFVFVV